MKKLLSFALVLVMLSGGIFSGCSNLVATETAESTTRKSDETAAGTTETATAATEGESETAGESEVSAQSRTVIDQMGTEVVLPKEVNKVVNLWHANNQVVLLLGAADKLVGTTSVIKSNAWYSTVYPEIADVPNFAVSAADVNVEEILAVNPDVVIVSNSDVAEILRDAGITTAVVTYRDFEGMKETIRITGEILGEEESEKADEYLEYLEGNIERVTSVTDTIADEDKPLVYEIRGESLLNTDGRISICTEWLEMAGGINAIADAVEDNQSVITMEEVLSANPDVIIVANQGAQDYIDEIYSDSTWSTITAVMNQQIYANPIGTFNWAAYSAEEALQILWVAQTLHPDLFADINMVEEVQNFYSTFYSYNLTEDEANLILSGQFPGSTVSAS